MSTNKSDAISQLVATYRGCETDHDRAMRFLSGLDANQLVALAAKLHEQYSAGRESEAVPSQPHVPRPKPEWQTRLELLVSRASQTLAGRGEYGAMAALNDALVDGGGHYLLGALQRAIPPDDRYKYHQALQARRSQQAADQRDAERRASEQQEHQAAEQRRRELGEKLKAQAREHWPGDDASFEAAWSDGLQERVFADHVSQNLDTDTDEWAEWRRETARNHRLTDVRL